MVLGAFELLTVLIGIGIVLILPLIALIDILRNTFRENDKLIWVLVVLFLPFVGALLYYFIGTKQKKSSLTSLKKDA